MTDPGKTHRLDGLEADNLLAFLALLGLLRALETAREAWRPKAAWDLDSHPLRPVLHLRDAVDRQAVCEAAAEGVADLAAAHNFTGLNDIGLSPAEARARLQELQRGGVKCKPLGDTLSALFSNAAISIDGQKVEPTPLAYPSVATSNFLRNLEIIMKAPMPAARSRDQAYPSNPAEAIGQALFNPWDRLDRPVGLRWDHEEARRHAYRLRAPTKDEPTTQHGANRLSAVGFSALTVTPVSSQASVRLRMTGGEGRGESFSVAWPIWSQPISLATVRALMSHPDLRAPGKLRYLGVDDVMVARRFSLDRLRNYARAESLRNLEMNDNQT